MTNLPAPASIESIEAADAVEAAPLNLHMQQLAYLQAVERWGSLTEAARRLGVTQPALSQAIAQLERRLGTPLLERAGRGRRLTEAGIEVARFASEVLGRATELREWLQEYEAGAGGVLRVGMIDAASLYVLPETVRAFRAASPGVEVRLAVDRSAVLLERLARFELDVAFVVGPPPEGYRSTEVLSEPLYVYAPPGSGGNAGAGRLGALPAGPADAAADRRGSGAARPPPARHAGERQPGRAAPDGGARPLLERAARRDRRGGDALAAAAAARARRRAHAARGPSRAGAGRRPRRRLPAPRRRAWGRACGVALRGYSAKTR